MKKIEPEYVFIHKPKYQTITCSSKNKFDGDLVIISINKLSDDAEKIKLSSIKEKCYIDGYGTYKPNKKN